MNISIKFLNENAKMPTRGSDAAAGYDLYACNTQDVIVAPHTTAKIGTGLSMSFDTNYFAGIYARSGLATKEGLRPANCVGVCDADYRGEYIVAIHNDSNITRIITPGEKIAQVIFQKYEVANFNTVEELDETERGDGGFGSTGK